MGIEIFFGLTDAWEDARKEAELDADARRAFDTMRRDVVAVIPAYLSGISARGYHATTEDPRFFQVVLGDDQLELPVYSSNTDSAAIPRRIKYRVDRSEIGHKLVRIESDLDAPLDAGTSSTVIERSDVLRLRFEFAEPDTGEWSESWARPGMPAAVRVSMTLGYRDRIPQPGPPKLQIARKAVFPIHVR